MSIQLKTGSDKASKLYNEVREFVRSRAGVDMHEGPLSSLNCRWLSAEKAPEISATNGARRYKLVWIFDITVGQRGKTLFELKIGLYDTLGMYTSFPVPLSFNDWQETAKDIEWSYDYLCRGQNAHWINLRKREEELPEVLREACL